MQNDTASPRFPWDPNVFGSRDYFSMVWFIILAILGSLFNGLAVFTLAMMRKTRLDQYWFMLLATADFLLSSFNGAVKAIRHVRFWREGFQYYATNSHCKYLGFFNYVFLGTVTVILVAIAIDRCLIIIKQSKYVSFTQRHVRLLATSSSIFIISLPAASVTAPLFDKGTLLYFDTEQVTCTMKMNLYKLVIVGSFVYIPLIIMVIMYSAILIYYFRQQKKIGGTDTAGNSTTKMSKRDLKLVQTMATIVFVYLICYLPYTIVSFTRFVTYFSLRISGLLVYTTVLTDPLVYFALNKNMRSALLMALRCKRYIPGSSGGTSHAG